MAVTDPLEPLLDEAAFDLNLNIRILRLASSLATILKRSTLREKGVTTQEYRVFVSIARHGAMHVRAVARKASMDSAHVSRTMKAMQTKGWLTRFPHPDDKRLAIFSMTDQGRDLFFTIYLDANALAKDFAGLFTEQDAIQFRDMLDRAGDHAAELLGDKDAENS